jgi:hypothetical protein
MPVRVIEPYRPGHTVGYAMRKPLLLFVPLLCSLTGCSRAFSVPVLGAYFPDWLFCILAGVLLTCVVRALLLRAARGDLLVPPLLAYPALIVLFSSLSWLLVFN